KIFTFNISPGETLKSRRENPTHAAATAVEIAATSGATRQATNPGSRLNRCHRGRRLGTWTSRQAGVHPARNGMASTEPSSSVTSHAYRSDYPPLGWTSASQIWLGATPEVVALIRPSPAASPAIR